MGEIDSMGVGQHPGLKKLEDNVFDDSEDWAQVSFSQHHIILPGHKLDKLKLRQTMAHGTLTTTSDFLYVSEQSAQNVEKSK